jgi:hypothetical protein
MAVKLSVICTGRALLPETLVFRFSYSFLLEAEGLMRPGGLNADASKIYSFYMEYNGWLKSTNFV